MKRSAEEANLDDLITLYSRPIQNYYPQLSDKLSTFSGISDTKIFDRQIRLWGIEIQQRLMNSTVLFAGKNVILEETAKNCLLTGMNIKILNCQLVDEIDRKFSFFIKSPDLGTPHSLALANRLQNITTDPRRVSGHIGAICTARSSQIHVHLLQEINIEFDTLDYSRPGVCPFCTMGYNKTDLNELSKSIQVICVAAEDYPLHTLVELDHMCRCRFKSLYVAYCNGTSGFFVSDPGIHQVLDTGRKDPETNQPITASLSYPSFESFFIKPTWKFDKRCYESLKCGAALILVERLAPRVLYNNPTQNDITVTQDICNKIGANFEEFKRIIKEYRVQFTLTGSILGGYLSLEIRKFVSKQHETFPNMCFFDMNYNVVTTAMI